MAQSPTEIMLGILQLDLLIGLLIVMTSGLVRGFTGFAGALVNVPLLTLLWGPVEAIAIASADSSPEIAEFESIREKDGLKAALGWNAKRFADEDAWFKKSRDRG